MFDFGIVSGFVVRAGIKWLPSIGSVIVNLFKGSGTSIIEIIKLLNPKYREQLAEEKKIDLRLKEQEAQNNFQLQIKQLELQKTLAEKGIELQQLKNTETGLNVKQKEQELEGTYMQSVVDLEKFIDNPNHSHLVDILNFVRGIVRPAIALGSFTLMAVIAMKIFFSNTPMSQELKDVFLLVCDFCGLIAGFYFLDRHFQDKIKNDNISNTTLKKKL